MEDTEELTGGRLSAPVKVGSEVHRVPHRDNAQVHSFLAYIAQRGGRLTPQYLGETPDGRERLTYIQGKSAYPPYSPEIRSEEALQSVGRAVRSVHDSGASYEWDPSVPPNTYDVVVPAKIDCIGHNDLAPWNIIFNGSTVKGIIDWDSAGPSNRVWDFSYLAHHLVPFHADADLAAWGWDQVPDRRSRLAMLIDAYGRDLMDPEELVDSAVLRLASIGSYIGDRVRHNDPLFEVQAIEGHAKAYMLSAAKIVEMKDRLL